MEFPSKTYELERSKSSESSIYSRNTKWFEEIYVERWNTTEKEPYLGGLLEVGKIYSFYYDPKTKDKLAFYDNVPMSIIIGHVKTKAGNTNALGINLSFIPPKTRAAVLDKIVKIFNTMIIKPNEALIEEEKFASQKELPLYYDICKKILQNSGFEFAIRSYIYKRMESEPKVITYTDWWRLLTFPSKYIVKLNVRAIYIRYKKNADEGYRVGQKDKKVNISRTKIKDIKDYLKIRNKE